MAKTTIGVGQFSGKVGGLVYAVSGGQQVVRAYQPVVINPKSDAQSLQRAKGNLVGRLSHLVKSDLLVGMIGANRRARRSAWLSSLLKATTAVKVEADFIASLNGNAVKFSMGLPLSLASLSPDSFVVDSGSLFLSWREGSDLSKYPDSKGLVIFLIHNSTFESLNPTENAWRIVTAEVSMASRQTSIDLGGVGQTGDAITAYAWVCPYIPNPELGSINTSMPDAETNKIVANLSYFDTNSVSYVDSAYLGSGALTI